MCSTRLMSRCRGTRSRLTHACLCVYVMYSTRLMSRCHGTRSRLTHACLCVYVMCSTRQMSRCRGTRSRLTRVCLCVYVMCSTRQMSRCRGTRSRLARVFESLVFISHSHTCTVSVIVYFLCMASFNFIFYVKTFFLVIDACSSSVLLYLYETLQNCLIYRKHSRHRGTIGCCVSFENFVKLNSG